MLYCVDAIKHVKFIEKNTNWLKKDSTLGNVKTANTTNIAKTQRTKERTLKRCGHKANIVTTVRDNVRETERHQHTMYLYQLLSSNVHRKTPFVVMCFPERNADAAARFIRADGWIPSQLANTAGNTQGLLRLIVVPL